MKPIARRLLWKWICGLPGAITWLSMVLSFLILTENREVLSVGVQYAIVLGCCLILGPFLMWDSLTQHEIAEDRRKQAKQVEDMIDELGRAVDPSWNDHLINRVNRALRENGSTKAVALYHDAAGVTWDTAHQQLQKWQSIGMAGDKLELLGRVFTTAHTGSV